MKKIKHVVWETILILASVLIFRSLWHILDKYTSFNQDLVLWIALIIGLIFAGVAFYILSHDD